MDLLRWVENWAAPFVLVMTAALLVWAVDRANGLGPLLAQPGRLTTFAEFFPVFIPSLTAMIGYWATLSLNMPDFTRFGRSQREQMLGQVVALPTTMSVFAAMGVLITSATVVIYGEAIWDPVKLVGQFQTPIVVAISMFTAVVATLAVNIAANVVSPANDFANAFPRRIDFKTGGLITGIWASLMQPWKLLADPSGYIFTWLLGYSGGLGSIAGVLIADYWVVRRTRLRLEDLYLVDGAYRYAGGWNWQALWPPRCSAAPWPGAVWSCRRSHRSTTTRGSSGLVWRSSCTRCRCAQMAPLGPRDRRSAHSQSHFFQGDRSVHARSMSVPIHGRSASGMTTLPSAGHSRREIAARQLMVIDAVGLGR